MGAIYVEQEQNARAIAHFKKIAKQSPQRIGHLAYYYIGRIELESQKLGQAEKAFQQSLQLKPDFVDSLTALGKLWEKQDRKAQAMALYQSYQDRFGAEEKLAEILGRLYMEEERYEEALSQYQILERTASDSIGIKVKIALLLIEQKKYRDAAVKLQEVLREVPESDKIRFYLAAVYEEMKDYDAAIREFAKIPPTSSFYVEAVIHAAYLYKLQDNYQEAVARLEMALSFRSDVAQLYTLYVSLLDDQQQWAKALEVLEKAAPQFPENPQIHFFLGSLYDKLGNREKMVLSLKKVLEIDSDYVQALNYLAYSYAERNENLDEALTLAERAMELKPNDAYIADTLGWVLYKQGKYGEAVKRLEMAYSLKPGEAIIAEHLGDAYLRHQLQTKAMWMYQKAMELTANEQNKRDLSQKILNIEKASMEARALSDSVSPQRRISSETD